jgi:hypothetical protein
MVMPDLDMHLGAIGPRPSDPAELKYSLTRTLPPRAVDLSQPRLLSRWNGKDVRLPIGDQGAMGACASWSSSYAVMMAGRISGRTIEALAPGPLYEQARRKQGWFPQDSGSYIADNLDLLLAGGPSVIQPYVADARFDYDDRAWDGQSQRDYEGSHRPFFPSEGQFAENVWSALDAGMPVVFGSYWPDAWFNPSGGAVDPAAPFSPSTTGAHAYLVWGSIPNYWLCQNSWSEGWNTKAPQLGYDCRKGDFAIPWLALPRGLIWEARAVSFEPVVLPEPEPQPDLATALRTVAHRSLDTIISEVRANPGSNMLRWQLTGGERVRDEVEKIWREAAQ